MTQDGLPHSTVSAIVQDEIGFMWFGTQEGLARYDGNRFVVFRHDDKDPTSLSNDWVWSLLMDSQDRLWIGTNEGGLNLWQPESNGFRRFVNDERDPRSLSNNRVRALFEDREGRIWVGTDSGLNVLNPLSGTFERYLNDPSNPDSLAHNQIRTIYEDKQGTIWVGTNGGGLDRLDKPDGTFTHYRHIPGDASSLSRDRVRIVYEDSADNFWVGTYEGGLNLLDRNTGRFRRFVEDPTDPSSLNGNRVTAIFEDAGGVVWIGTWSGLSEWRPDRQSFSGYSNNPADPTTLSDSRVMCIFQDRGGVLWVGTRGGISKWNPITGSFSGFRHDPAKPARSLISNTVNAFAQDKTGRLWVGTYEGLDLLEQKTGIVVHHARQDSRPGSLRDDRVMSLHTDNNDTLWVGTFEGGLHRREEDGSFTNFRHDRNDPTSLSRDSVTAIYHDSKNVLWVGTYGGGLNRFSSDQTRFIRYLHDSDNVTSISSNQVLALAEGSDGVLWVGTDGGGLDRFDRRTGAFTRYRSNPEDPTSLSSDTIFSLLESSDGTLWIGTQGGGLSRWEKADRASNRANFKTYRAEDGLNNDTVYGVLEDDQGLLWLSTNDGLARFDPKTETFWIYDATHGLLSTEFNFGAFLKTREGEMLFGGNEGFNSFRPDSIRSNEHVPPVVLTSFLKFNKEVRTEVPTPLLQDLSLSYKDYVVSFEFTALDFSAPDKNRYSYKLEGFDEDWTDVETLSRVTYTNLDPGSYAFRVKAANNDGLWNENGLTLRIYVVPPPWRTWWAYLLYLAAGLAVLLGILRRQTGLREKEAQQRRELEQQVRLRTSELAERNTDLEEAIDKLEVASVTDALTGLRNRRYLVNNIDGDLALVDRHYENLKRRPDTATDKPEPDFMFLLFDLDGFKDVNDTYGHAAGDLILLQVTELLQGACRDSDTVVRWGGDEFLIVARQTNRKAAEELAERLRASITGHSFELGPETSVELSCSIGFAYYPFLRKFPRALTWEQVLAVADRALYVAKKSHRDAWVGIYEGDRVDTVHPSSLLHQINHELDQLVQMGVVELQTSIEESHQLVWAWA